MEIITKNGAETQTLGQKIVANCIKSKRKNTATIILLQGELGSGKTTFVQGVAKALGIPRRVVSPTFILMREYELQTKQFKRLYHIDLYRIKEESELDSLGLNDIFVESGNLVCIEWPQLIRNKIPAGFIPVFFEVMAESSHHKIKIQMHKCTRVDPWKGINPIEEYADH